MDESWSSSPGGNRAAPKPGQQQPQRGFPPGSPSSLLQHIPCTQKWAQLQENPRSWWTHLIRRQRGIRNSELPWCCFKAARCHRQITGVRPLKAGERRKMFPLESFNHPSNSKPETRTHPGLQTGTSTAQGRKLRGCGRRSWDKWARSEPWRWTAHRAGALARVSALTQKEGGGGNFGIPLFKYIVRC